MEIVYDPELLEYMQKKGKKNISVEVAEANTSDFEITELFYRFVKDDFAVYLKEKKRYRGISTEVGEVLLPPYRLEYSDVVTFRFKKTLFFRSLTADGIRF